MGREAFLLPLPDVVGLEELGEGVVLLGCLDLFDLCCYAVVVGWCVNVADDTEGYWEAVAVAHEGELELEGIVLAMSVVHEDVVERVAVLADLHHAEAEALLHEAILAVGAEDEFLAVLDVDGVLCAAGFVVDALVSAVVEDDAVLQHLGDAGALVGVGSLEHLDGVGAVGSHGAGEEVAAGIVFLAS